MKLLTYKGYFENGRFILPESVMFPKNGEFTITFIEETEEDMKEKREKQRAAFNKFVESLKEIKDEPLGEEFDKIMSERLRFRTPEELDLCTGFKVC